MATKELYEEQNESQLVDESTYHPTFNPTYEDFYQEALAEYPSIFPSGALILYWGLLKREHDYQFNIRPRNPWSMGIARGDGIADNDSYGTFVREERALSRHS